MYENKNSVNLQIFALPRQKYECSKMKIESLKGIFLQISFTNDIGLEQSPLLLFLTTLNSIVFHLQILILNYLRSDIFIRIVYFLLLLVW